MGTFWQKTLFFWKQKSFPQFLDIEQKVFSILSKKFLPGCWNCILGVCSNISSKMFFKKKDTLVILSSHWAIIFPHFVCKYPAGLPKMSSPYPLKLSEEVWCVFEKIIFFSIYFPDIEQNAFGWRSKNFPKVRQLVFYVSIGTFWGSLWAFLGNLFFFSKIHILFSFGSLNEKILAFFWKAFVAGVSKLQFTWSEEQFDRKCCFFV